MKIPKDFMKGKTVDFYKATVLKQGDEMLVNTGGDVFALDPEHAVKEFFNSMTAAELKKKLGTCITESFQFDVSEDDITNLEINGENAASIMKDDAIVVLLTIHLNKDDVTERYVNSMMDDGSMTIILKLQDDHYTIDIQNYAITDFKVTFANDGVGKKIHLMKLVATDDKAEPQTITIKKC